MDSSHSSIPFHQHGSAASSAADGWRITSALRKFRATDPTLGGLRVRGVLRRSGGPERLICIGQASRVIYRRFKNIVLFNSGGGLGTVVEESRGEEGYVVWLLA